MDRTRLSTLAHQDHLFCSPLDPGKVDRLLGLLDLPPGGHTLDVGCGKAAMLLRLVERFDAWGVGVDTNRQFLEEGRAQAAARGLEARLRLHHAEAAGFAATLEPERFDVALCVGSTHVFGGYREALSALSSLVRAESGQLVVGEAYWKREPDPEYLAALGASRNDYQDHAANVAAGVEAGLVPLYASVSSEDDWDHYEGLYCRAIERYARAHPGEPEAEAFRQYVRQWRDTYLRFGRDTLGFGLYLFLKP